MCCTAFLLLATVTPLDSVSYPAGAARPEWLTQYAEKMDGLFPYEVKYKFFAREKGDSDYVMVLESVFKTDGASTWESLAVFYLNDPSGVRKMEKPYKMTWSSDGVQNRSIANWVPGDEMPEEFKPATPPFDRIYGAVAPFDPKKRIQSPVSRAGLNLNCGSYAKVFGDADLLIETEPGRRVVTITGGMKPTCVGSQFTFEHDERGVRLVSVKDGEEHSDPGVREYRDFQLIEGYWLPRERTFETRYSSSKSVYEDFSLTPPEEPVEQVTFRRGMRVKDASVGLDKTIIWGDGKPARVLSAEENQTYGYSRYVSPTEEAIEGRSRNRWTDWLVNGGLAAAAVMLVLTWRRSR